ncbi:hypothetical protein [Saccharopolyspora elongata]|uniref:Guanylate cyclase domain-containing protein n=1 Tax=Saccharopolyspora elongata TaxID=2530387 RepID=A0A4R4YR97_9PSEU|nr:hypothetical protein [Saccharopolyspora elongata]TDD47721.1 hypothetical protein E1288_23950 [Saccharopolyspora elongata]
MTPSWETLWPYRAVLAVDARGFSAHTSKTMQQLNADIQQVLAQTLSAIGMSGRWEQRMFGQHTGDGYVAGLEPEVLPGLVGCFPEALRQVLSAWRNGHPGQPPLQLRVSIHVGPLPTTGLGVPMVHTHRLLDDQALRDLLARANPEVTNTVMIISQRVYEDVFQSGCATGDTLSSNFSRRLARVKTFEQPAWLHVPGLDWRLADPAIFETPDAEPASEALPAPSASVSATAAPGSVTFTQHGPYSISGYSQNINNTFGGNGR